MLSMVTLTTMEKKHVNNICSQHKYVYLLASNEVEAVCTALVVIKTDASPALTVEEQV